MQLRTKRWVTGLGVGVGIGALAITTLIGARSGDEERVASLQVHATIDPYGPTRVTEVIDYDFGANDRHGIYRTIPDLDSTPAIQVSSPDAPDQFEVSLEGGQQKIKIGDPNKKISGRHRYQISYNLLNQASGRKLAFDAIGTEWEVPIRLATVDVVTPAAFTGLRCDRGTTGDTGGCETGQPEPGHLRMQVKDLDKGDGITLYGTAQNSLIDVPRLPSFSRPPADDSPALAAPVLAALVAAAIAGLVGLVLTRRAGREWVSAGGAADAAFLTSPGAATPTYSALPPPPGRQFQPEPVAAAVPTDARRIDAAALATMATTEFAPPPGLSAAHGSVVLTESVGEDAKAAWLIEQTIAGTVAFDASTGTKQLLRSNDPQVRLPPVLENAFAGRTSISLGSYDPTFGSAWTNLGAELKNWRMASGLWDPAGDKRRTSVGVLGVVGGLIGLAGTFFFAWAGVLPLVVLTALVGGLGIASGANSWELAVRTPAGSATWLRVESFRRFLHDSEVQHVDWAVQHGVLREYTAWAVAVGEIDRWNNALSRSTMAPQVDPSAFAYASMAYSFAGAAHTASTAPSSSGGGGGVGGGGGGGGGGSW